jgi:hypothetical protein
VLADLGFCVPLRSLCCLILVCVFLKEHKNQDQPTQTPQRNTKTKIIQHKLRKGTQKPRSANTNSAKEHKNQDQPTQTLQRNTKILCSFAEFVLDDLGFCVPLRSLCWLIPVFLLLLLGRYLCWWTSSPRWYHPPGSQCFYCCYWVDTSAGGLVVPRGIIRPVVSVFIVVTWSIPLLVD